MTPRSCSSGDPLPRGSTIPHSGQISRVPLGPASPLCLTVGPGQTLTEGDLPRCREPADFMCGLSPDQHPHLLACKQGPGEMQGHQPLDDNTGHLWWRAIPFRVNGKY